MTTTATSTLTTTLSSSSPVAHLDNWRHRSRLPTRPSRRIKHRLERQLVPLLPHPLRLLRTPRQLELLPVHESRQLVLKRVRPIRQLLFAVFLVRRDRLHPLVGIHRRTPNLHHDRAQPGPLLGRRGFERPAARAAASTRSRTPKRNHFLHVPKDVGERLVVLE